MKQDLYYSRYMIYNLLIKSTRTVEYSQVILNKLVNAV